MPYPYFIVCDFEAILVLSQSMPMKWLTVVGTHVPWSVVVNDNFTNMPVFLKHQDPEMLIQLFVNELTHWQAIISKQVWDTYPMVDPNSLPECIRGMWMHWVNQVPILGFNSRTYDLNLVKEHFMCTLANMSDIHIVKKDTTYVFLATPQFKFLDVRNYLASGLSYDGWCKADRCTTEKTVFLYKWLDNYSKLSHVGLVAYKAFHSSLKGNIS